jgi:hypothetical protein
MKKAAPADGWPGVAKLFAFVPVWLNLRPQFLLGLRSSVFHPRVADNVQIDVTCTRLTRTTRNAPATVSVTGTARAQPHNAGAASVGQLCPSPWPAGAKAGSPQPHLVKKKAPDGCSFAGAKGCWSGQGDGGWDVHSARVMRLNRQRARRRLGSSAPAGERCSIWMLQDGQWDAQSRRRLPARTASQEKHGHVSGPGVSSVVEQWSRTVCLLLGPG